MITSENFIKDWTAQFVSKLKLARQALGIKHKRTQDPLGPKAVIKKSNGEVVAIGIRMSKGDIMTHKGAGPGTRKEKPWYNPVAEEELPVLADQLANEIGDVVSKGLLR